MTRMNPAAKFLKDVAMEASGLSSAERIYKQDIRPYARGKWKSRKGNRPSRARGGSARSRVGDTPTFDNAQRQQILSIGSELHATRVLYSDELTAIPQATSAFDIDARRRQLCVVKGFKICLEFHNVTSNPMYVNWAVIAPKGNNDVGTGASPVPVEDFFRSNGSERARDFSTTMTALQFHCDPINSDRYEILRHKRMLIGGKPGASDYTHSVKNNYIVNDEYIKLNRQVRWNASQETMSGACYLAYWFDELGTSTSGASVANALEVSQNVITYFKEPLQCM